MTSSKTTPQILCSLGQHNISFDSLYISTLARFLNHLMVIMRERVVPEIHKEENLWIGTNEEKESSEDERPILEFQEGGRCPHQCSSISDKVLDSKPWSTKNYDRRGKLLWNHRCMSLRRIRVEKREFITLPRHRPASLQRLCNTPLGKYRVYDLFGRRKKV